MKNCISLNEEGNPNNCKWTLNTKISNCIPLYDTNGLFNGVIFNFKNNSQEAGFMQLSYFNNNFETVMYAYNKNRNIIDEIPQTKARSNVKPKIIFSGGSNYYFSDGSNYTNVLIQESDQISKTQLQNSIDNFKDRMTTKNENAPQPYAMVATQGYVPNYNVNDISVMSDWYGKTYNLYNSSTTYKMNSSTQSCAPTAGTTLISYWANRRGVTKLRAATKWWTCASLIQTMKMTPAGGVTSSERIKDGLEKYSSYVMGVNFTGCDYLQSDKCTKTKCISIINAEVPFIINRQTLLQVGTRSSHAVACFGYRTFDNGSTHLMVADGYERDYIFINFDSMHILNMAYVRWN